MTLPSVCAVACDFPGNLDLLSLTHTKRLSRSHMEYSVVHIGDAAILPTPGSFGDSLTVRPPPHAFALTAFNSLTMS